MQESRHIFPSFKGNHSRENQLRGDSDFFNKCFQTINKKALKVCPIMVYNIS